MSVSHPPRRWYHKARSGLEGAKKPGEEDKVQQALERIHKNIDVLVLHQTTRHIGTGDHILEELSKLNVASPESKPLGQCLGLEPQMEPDALIGRTAERHQMQSWLSPINHPHCQRIVSIIGIIGIGKRQLSLTQVRDHGDDYSSILGKCHR